MNNRLTESKTHQSCQQDVKLNKTNTDAEAPSLLLALSFLYGLIDSDSCSAALPANAFPQKTHKDTRPVIIGMYISVFLCDALLTPWHLLGKQAR